MCGYVRVSTISKKAREDSGVPIVGVAGRCESHDMGAGNKPPVLLAELFLQLLSCLCLPTAQAAHLRGHRCHPGPRRCHPGLWRLPLSPAQHTGFESILSLTLAFLQSTEGTVEPEASPASPKVLYSYFPL